MARGSTHFVCQHCGTSVSKWTGKCEGCGAWNSMVEEAIEPTKAGSSKRKGPKLHFVGLQNPLGQEVMRMISGVGEFDRVTGGGLVPGAVILVGGDPGIGKSTLLLQIAAELSQTYTVAYVSGEEGLDQIRMRAGRLKVAGASVQLASSTSISEILESMDCPESPAILIVDSIQTVCVEGIESAPGTVGQIRAAAHELTRLAKKRGITVILVGHVTKEGVLAGPRVLEHMVDTVLYFEGERGHHFRLLRAVKNRFGPTDEIGVFDMTEKGLQEVQNPSALFLSHRSEEVTGSCILASMEGTRPLLVEMQALVAPSFLPSPRRSVVGWEPQRLAMILAVLEARCRLNFSGKDVYLSALGGLKIMEPAADLAVALALVSCIQNIAVPRGWVAFGEISLSGEVRPVTQQNARLKEASKLGFTGGLIPRTPQNIITADLAIRPLSHVHEMVSWLEAEGQEGTSPPRVR